MKMTVYLFFTFIIGLMGMQPAKNGEFHKTYISRNQSTSVNGLFTLFVFLTHATNYIKLGSVYDSTYNSFKIHLLQLIVVPFLFYSGYGVMESIRKKGMDYVKQVPKNRFLKVLTHFVIAVSFYLIYNICCGKSFPLSQILLSFIGYSSIGNSSWYIFAVLGLYLIVFVSFMLARKNHFLGAILATLLSIAFIYMQIRLKRPGYCYNTTILFPAGMLFSLLRKPIEKIVMKNDIFYFCTLGITIIGYIFFFLKRAYGVEFYSIWGMFFMGLILLVNMKIQMCNGLLEFLGSHVFSIYILQRLPMMIFQKIGLAQSHRYIFIAASFFVTLAMAVVFDAAMNKLDSKLFARKKKVIENT